MAQSIRIIGLYGLFAAAALFGTAILFAYIPTGPVVRSHGESAALPPSPPYPPDDFATADEFIAATRSGRRVIYIDTGISISAAAWRRTWEEFRDRADAGYDVQAVNPGTDFRAPRFVAVAEWLRRNEIDPGGLQTFGGAGRVVWVDDGVVRDYAWGWDLNSGHEVAERTRRAFGHGLL